MNIPLDPWTLSLAAAAFLFALFALVLVARIRSTGRVVDALLGVCLILFLAVLFVGSRETTPAAAAIEGAPVQAAAVPVSRSDGTCASLEPGREAARAKAMLGTPDRVESASHLRGPGAEIWRYDASRCAVHVFEGTIEFIE
jgi:signal transduction histidine kinase